MSREIIETLNTQGKACDIVTHKSLLLQYYGRVQSKEHDMLL
jgi:hypothetical protein